MGSTSYRQVVFQVHDFLKYTKQSQNHYQLKKLVGFFNELQKNSLIHFFSDKGYRSLVTIPEVNLDKGKHNSWIAKVWIAEELFYYTHPFCLPNLFNKKLTKHEFEVQFKVIQVFSSINVEKTFFIKDFFESYPSVLSNQQKTKMKKYFIEWIKLLEEYELIDSTYRTISKGDVLNTDKLTTTNISEGFIVYEKLSI